jgi:hypothetical protein
LADSSQPHIFKEQPIKAKMLQREGTPTAFAASFAPIEK